MNTLAASAESPSASAEKGSFIPLTASQALIRFLCAQYVEDFDGTFFPLFGGMWGIFGHGNVAGVAEALWQHREFLPYFRGQNEQGMAHAAIAYAKAHRGRRVMGVTTSIGPGATNLITAAALAHVNRLPVLFIPGDQFASRRPDPVLQQLEKECSPLASVNDTFIPVSRFFDRITRPEQLLASLPFAVETLVHPLRRGPVTLAFPQDTQTEKYDYPSSFFEPRIHRIFRPRPDSRQTLLAAKLIEKAKKPLIIAGGGVHYSGAELTLSLFAERHAIPVAETQAGKGSLAWDNPLNVGSIGVTGSSAANALARDSDLILCIGTRLSDFTTASKSLFHAHTIPFININISDFDAIKGNAQPLIGDVQACLDELTLILKGKKTDPSYRQSIQILKMKWLAEHHEVVSQNTLNSLPTDAQVLAAVNQAIDKNAIVVCAAGGLPGELHKHWHADDPIGYHVEYGYSCMGYEIAGGLGVKMAYPEREVYVLVGDGSYLMMHSELLTSNQLGYKINVIVLDNRGFGCINRLQNQCGVPSFGNLFDSSPESPRMDFVKNAESYGCHAKKVSTLDALAETIKDNRTLAKSCVTVIDTDPKNGSPGYAWWDVAVPEHSEEATVIEARKQYEQQILKLKRRA